MERAKDSARGRLKLNHFRLNRYRCGILTEHNPFRKPVSPNRVRGRHFPDHSLEPQRLGEFAPSTSERTLAQARGSPALGFGRRPSSDQTNRARWGFFSKSAWARPPTSERDRQRIVMQAPPGRPPFQQNLRRRRRSHFGHWRSARPDATQECAPQPPLPGHRLRPAGRSD
jgi:hypothetical protein